MLGLLKRAKNANAKEINSTRRRFAFWLGFGAFTVAENLRLPAIDQLAAKLMESTEETTENPYHWVPAGNADVVWFQQEQLIEGRWQITGFTTAMDRHSGEVLPRRKGQLDPLSVPKSVREAALRSQPVGEVADSRTNVVAEGTVQQPSPHGEVVVDDGSGDFVIQPPVPIVEEVVVQRRTVEQAKSPLDFEQVQGPMVFHQDGFVFADSSSTVMLSTPENPLPLGQAILHSGSASKKPFTRQPDPAVREREGLPPSRWLRSLQSSELRTWLLTIKVPEVGVGGMTFWEHLTKHHMFDPNKIQGLTDHELMLLHSAAHFGY